MMKVNNSKKMAELVMLNKETLKVFRNTDKKRGLKRAKNAKDMFEKLDIK